MGAVLSPLLTSRLSQADVGPQDGAAATEGPSKQSNSDPQDVVTLHTEGVPPTAAEEAGLFQVGRLAQVGAITPIPLPGQADNARPVDPPAPVALGTLTVHGNAAATAPPPPAQAPAHKASASPPAQPLPAQSSQLNTLDDTLRAEGLTQDQIRQINQIAKFFGVFNPAAYRALVEQMQRQLQENPSQAPANTQQTQEPPASAAVNGQNPQPATTGPGSSSQT